MNDVGENRRESQENGDAEQAEAERKREMQNLCAEEKDLLDHLKTIFLTGDDRESFNRTFDELRRVQRRISGIITAVYKSRVR